MSHQNVTVRRNDARLWSWRVAAIVASVATALPAHADPIAVTIELNKLETQDKGCRAYFVIDNPGTTNYDAMKLDLVLFQPDGVIGRRFHVDLAPFKAAKKTVKLFDLDGTACDKVGSLLINDVPECKTDGAAVDDCLAAITVKSLTDVQLMK